ncbi:MAG: PQQ-binding-like beta-propeller repeat protein [Planctomycetaceae bacterium]|nr:PQQ-binding-like beta-propeller repeat protein [Planctomycetaceae bacterium]
MGLNSSSVTRCVRTLTGLILFAFAGCQRPDPVDPITPQSSNVQFQETDLTALQTEWPQWRGPNQSGDAGQISLPTTWSETENIIWTADIRGRGHGSAAVVQDRIYLCTATEHPQQQIVLAFNAQDGKPLWDQVVSEDGFPPSNQFHQKSSHANGTPACDGERVYTAFLHHDAITAYALNAESGEIIWTTELGPFRSKFGYAPSPVLYHSYVIFACDHQGGGYLAAVDTTTGEIAWRTQRPAVSTYSSPRIASFDGKDHLLISGGRKVSSYDPRTGEQRWEVEGTAEATCGTVVVSADTIFASGGYPQKETIALSAKGQRVWANRTKAYEPSLLFAEELLFGVDDNGIAYCWDPRSGTELWKSRLGGNVSASPFAAGGRVYSSNLNGETYVFEASSSGYKQIAVNQLGSDSYASPAVWKQNLILRVGFGQGPYRQEKLVCIGMPD